MDDSGGMVLGPRSQWVIIWLPPISFFLYLFFYLCLGPSYQREIK